MTRVAAPPATRWRTGLRVIAAMQVAAGATLAARPNTVIHLVDRRRGGAPAWLVRVLGTRMLLQGVAEIAVDDPVVILGGGLVDATHAASMLAAAAASPRFRRPALVSAAVAGASAAALAATFGAATRGR